MTTLLGFTTEVLDFVIDALTAIFAAVVANPLLLLPIGIGVAVMLVGWARSFIHY